MACKSKMAKIVQSEIQDGHGSNLLNQWLRILSFDRHALVTLYQDCSRHHDWSKNLATMGHGLFFLYIENFKTLLLVETTETIRNVPLVTLYQDCSSHNNSLKNMAARGQGLFSLYIDI